MTKLVFLLVLSLTTKQMSAQTIGHLGGTRLYSDGSHSGDGCLDHVAAPRNRDSAGDRSRARGARTTATATVPLECGEGCARETANVTSDGSVLINVIFIVSDNIVTQVMKDKFAEFVATLNSDFAKLYSLAHWDGFEVGAVTRYYNDAWKATNGIHLQTCDNDDGVTNCVLNNHESGVMKTEQIPELIDEVEDTDAFLDNYVNIIIASTGGDSSIQGRTYLNGMLSAGTQLGAKPLGVYCTYGESFVCVHEMAHVIGVAHLAGTWPPVELTNERDDGVGIGINTVDYANTESSAMSSWKDDVYLSSTPHSLLQPTSGCYVAENLRSWLVKNAVIAADAPYTHLRQTTACGNNVGAPALVGNDNDSNSPWSSPKSIEIGQPGLSEDRAAIWPSVGSSHVSGTVLAAAAWSTSDNKLRVAYRGYKGAWVVNEATTSLPSAGGSASSHLHMNKGGTAVVVTTPWYNAAVEVAFHGPAKDAEWTTLTTVSNQPAADQLVQYQDETSHARVQIASTDVASVVWRQKMNGNSAFSIMFNEKRFIADGNAGDSGGAWPEAVVLRTTEGDSCGSPEDSWLQYPEISTNDAGDAFVVWMEQRPDDDAEGGGSGLGGHMIAGRFRDGACGEWGPIERISTDAAMHATLPHVALSSGGDAIVAWREVSCGNVDCDDEHGNGRVAARTRTKAGVYSNTLHLSEPDVDGFTALPNMRRNNVGFLPPSSNNGAGDTDAVVVWHGHGSATVGGGVYTVYSSIISSSTIAGSSSTVTIAHVTTAISTAGATSKAPSLVVNDDSTGSFAVGWQRDDGVNTRAEVRTYSGADGGAWSAAPVTVSEAGSSALWVSPTADGDGGYTVLWAQRPTTGYYRQLNMHESHTVGGVGTCYTEDDVVTEWVRGKNADGGDAGMCSGTGQFAVTHCQGDNPLPVCTMLYSSNDLKWGTECYGNFTCAKELCGSIPECGGLQTNNEQTTIWFNNLFDPNDVATKGHGNDNANYQCWVAPSIPDGAVCADGAATSYPSPTEPTICDSVGAAAASQQPTCKDADVAGAGSDGDDMCASRSVCGDTRRGKRVVKPGE